MNWSKFPRRWQVWSSSTLLASLTIHGLILTLPLAAQKEAPKPETLTPVSVTVIPSPVTANASPKQPESEPLVQPPPQPPEPLVEKSEPLFDRVPSRNWSSFPERVESFSRQPEAPEAPEAPVQEIESVEEVETLEAPLEELSNLEETTEHLETSSKTDGETNIDPENNQANSQSTLESQPSLDPRKKILLTSTPPIPPSGDSGEREDINKTFIQGNESVENWFSSLGKNEKGTVSKGETAITEMLQSFAPFQDISSLKSRFFDRDTLTQFKPEIDKEQSLFILSSTKSPVDLHKLREYYIQPLETQGFKITQEEKPSDGEIYRVEKPGIGFVRYIQLYETDFLEGQLLAGVIVWKEHPTQ